MPSSAMSTSTDMGTAGCSSGNGLATTTSDPGGFDSVGAVGMLGTSCSEDWMPESLAGLTGASAAGLRTLSSTAKGASTVSSALIPVPSALRRFVDLSSLLLDSFFVFFPAPGGLVASGAGGGGALSLLPAL